MKVYKDNEHSVALSPFCWRGKRYLMVSVGLYAVFDPESGRSRPRGEQDFWKEVPEVFAALGQTPVLDAGLPKPGAEALVAGFCRAPEGRSVQAQEVFFRVGTVQRRIAVFGDRERLPGGGLSDPLPFTALPLVWERALGGPDFSANPSGKGLAEDNKPARQAPNLENPQNLMLSGDDRPRPACPFPLDIAGPERRALSGTYDQAWLDTRWPAYPDDLNPDFFYSAQAEQRLAPLPGAPDTSRFFRGDEEIEIIGMNHEYPHIRSSLPEARIRAFVTTVERFAPFASATPENKDGVNAPPPYAEDRGKPPLPYVKDLDQPGIFQEVELRLDTVWLLPDLMGAFVLRRGLLPVEDDEMDDILRVYVVTEKPSETPQSLEYYLEEQKKRIRPPVEIDLAPFAAAQAQTTKAVKMARDVPKVFEKVKKDFLGQSPNMPLSLGDMAHSARKTLGTGRATLDTVEKQTLALREHFSHLMSFDLSIFSGMRAMLDAQEKNLDQVLHRAGAKLRLMERQSQKAAATLREQLGKALKIAEESAADGSMPEEAGAKKSGIQAALDKLDAFSPEGMLCKPQPLNPWHDRGIPPLIAARRALRRDDDLLARLVSLGFEEKTLEDAWVGNAAEAWADKPENWGMPPGPAFILPAGLYVPRFAGKALAALRVYPIGPAEPEQAGHGAQNEEERFLRGLGTDAVSIVLAPGSEASPLSLPAAHPDGAVCIAPEDLSALFAEQEAGDFCHIVAASDPAALAAVADLPPLFADAPLPDATEKKLGLPLVVILPPGAKGKELFAPWAKAHPAALPLYLPEGCPHVLALAGQGHRLRRLLLNVLPPDLAKIHDFDFPLPPKDRPPDPFTLNLPLPTQEELQGRIETLIKDIRSHFPDPEKLLAEEATKHKKFVLDMLRRADAPQEVLARVEAAFAPPKTPPAPVSVAQMLEKSLAGIEQIKAGLPSSLPPDARALVLAKLDKATARTRAIGERLLPLDALRAEGMAKLEAVEKGDLPEEIKAAFAEKGMDPNALKIPTRAEVEAALAGDKNLHRRNLQGLDLSGLDFSGADLSHAICAKTNFRGCRMDGADFTFTLANEADFFRASFREARFKQTVLQKAVLREADFTSAQLELTTLGESDAAGAVFDRAGIKLCNFDKAVLTKAAFGETLLSLCAFGETLAGNADFRKVRAFKCLFRKTDLAGARFEHATLAECLFQGAACAGLSFAGADLRKLRTDVEADFAGADFAGADLREASLRASRFPGADFYAACLENAFFTQCDLSRARLDGLRATGCRFIKCDLSGADISGTDLQNGALRKCRLIGASLSGTNLYASNLQNMVIGKTDFAGTNLKRTVLDGKEEALRHESRRDS